MTYVSLCVPLFHFSFCFFFSPLIPVGCIVALHQSPDDQRHVWVPLPGGRRHQNWERMETIEWTAFEQRIGDVMSGAGAGDGAAAVEAAASAAAPAGKRFLILDGHIILNHKWVTLASSFSLSSFCCCTVDSPEHFLSFSFSFSFSFSLSLSLSHLQTCSLHTVSPMHLVSLRRCRCPHRE